MNLRPGTSVALPLSASFALRRSSVRRGRSTSSFPPPRVFWAEVGSSRAEAQNDWGMGEKWEPLECRIPRFMSALFMSSVLCNG